MPNLRALLLGTLMLLPALAQAQDEVTDLSATISPSTLGNEDCGTDYTLTIQATNNGSVASGLEDAWTIRVSDSSNCRTGTSVSEEPVGVAGQPGTYRVQLTGSQIFSAAQLGTCGEDTVDDTVYVCAVWTNDGDEEVRDGAEVTVDTAGPGAPRITDVRPGDRRLIVSFETADEDDDDPASWRVCWREAPGGDESVEQGLGGAGEGGNAGGAGGEGGGEGGAGGEGGEGGAAGEGGGGGAQLDLCDFNESDPIAGTRRSYSLEGLRNLLTYQVQVVAIDDSDNRSEPSTIREGTPAGVSSFWDRYRAAGGEEDGGCAAASGPAAAALLLTGFLLTLRARARK